MNFVFLLFSLNIFGTYRTLLPRKMSNGCVRVCVFLCLPVRVCVCVCEYRLTGFVVIPLLFLYWATAALCRLRCLRRCLPFTCYFLGLFLTERRQLGQRACLRAAAAAEAADRGSFSCSTFNLCIIFAAAAASFSDVLPTTKRKKMNGGKKGKAQSLKIAKHRCCCCCRRLRRLGNLLD